MVFPNVAAYPVRFPVNPGKTHAGQTVVEEAGCRMGAKAKMRMRAREHADHLHPRHHSRDTALSRHGAQPATQRGG